MASKTTWDIVVIGGANTDYTVRGPRLPKPGETAVGKEFHTGQGGKGANQAVAVARLGAKVTFIARLGNDDRGDAMLKKLNDEGVDTRYVVRDPTTPTGAAVIHVEESGQKQIFSSPNANRKLSVADFRQAADAVKNAKVLVAQLEVPSPTLIEAVTFAHESGLKIVLDPAPPIEIPDQIIRRITTIKPNSSEAEYLTGIKVTDRDSARQAAQKLLKRGVQVVAVQAGDEGNLLVWNEGEAWLPNFPVKSVDATGAGDAFTAGFAVALCEGKSWEAAGRFASAAAALTTTQLGAQDPLPTHAAVDALLAKHP